MWRVNIEYLRASSSGTVRWRLNIDWRSILFVPHVQGAGQSHSHLQLRLVRGKSADVGPVHRIEHQAGIRLSIFKCNLVSQTIGSNNQSGAFMTNLSFPLSVTAFRYHCFFTHKSAALNYIFMVLLHYLPALLIDGLSICVGQKPRWVLKSRVRARRPSSPSAVGRINIELL